MPGVKLDPIELAFDPLTDKDNSGYLLLYRLSQRIRLARSDESKGITTILGKT